MSLRFRVLRWLSVGAACSALCLASCSGGSSSSPSTTPVTTLPAQADGGGTGGTQSCRLGAGSATAICSRTSSRLSDHVLSAMDQLLRQKPQIFDTKDEVAPVGQGNYRVLDKDAFIDGIIANLAAAGLCAQRDPNDAYLEQIQVKADDGYSEDFDVLLSSGHAWHNLSNYRRTCSPASFPVERSPELPPVGGGCGGPYPPAVHHFWVHELTKNTTYTVIDSTPVVGPDGPYCKRVGFTDGRLFCAVRPEGHPERLACENWRVGVAADSGRPGPTWRRAEGSNAFCTGSLTSGCENHPDNQYQLLAYKSGRYLVCTQGDLCSEITIQR